VVTADGTKIVEPIIGDNSVVAAGAIITKDMPVGSIAYGVINLNPEMLTMVLYLT
jgi:serine O-acetyltransferase